MNQKNDDPFYVGYHPTAPPLLRRWLRSKVILLLAVPLILGWVMVSQQQSFGPGVFEFQNYRDFEGTIIDSPMPALLLDRPGNANQGYSLYYLVAFGKKGGQVAVKGLAGKRVRVRGALLFRDNQTMVELEAGAESIEVLGIGATRPDHQALGEVTLRGEIVDSKCFFGLMKPGNLKTHKACAIRCISGGIPPVLLIRNHANEARYVLLVSRQGEAVNRQILDWVAEPVEITGELEQWGTVKVLKADPVSYRSPRD